MIYNISADFILIVHFIFVLFVIFGGFFVFKWKKFAWIHIIALIWGVFIEFANWTCPLTPLENWFREMGSEITYKSGFIEHHIIPVLYPQELTRQIQIILGISLICFNIVIYSWIVYKSKTKDGI